MNNLNVNLQLDGHSVKNLAEFLLGRGDYNNASALFQHINWEGALFEKILLEELEHKSKNSLQLLVAINNRLRELNLPKLFIAQGMVVFDRNMTFLEDEVFVSSCKKHSHLLPLPNWHWNLHVVLWAARHALNVDGDFMELGVFKGHTSAVILDCLEFSKNTSKKMYLYDTFEGIPEDQVDDQHWARVNSIYKGTFGFEEVSERFSKYQNVKVIKGRVPEVLQESCPEKISFVHMDLNNSSAELAALDFIWDKRMSSGGLVVFDDFGWSVSKKQNDCERAWAKNRGLGILELPTGQGLLLKP